MGNRTEKLQDGDSYQYEYNNLNQLTKEVTPAGEINYQYDAEGSLTFRGNGNRGETYTYSADGKLLTCENNTGGTVTKETYTYDGEGNRLTKEETAGNTGRKTCYVTDNRTGYSQTVLELDGGKKVQAAYERGDSLLTVRTKEGTKTYLTDGHGDVRYLTDEEGHVTDSYRYSAYGELTEKSGNTKNPYLYCGEYYDEGTGLYYLRARYMRPSTGTFISMDSYQGNAYDPASLHKYTYAQNNPQMYNDPSGHFIALISNMTTIASNSIMNNLHTLNVMGMIGGFMNATVSQVFDTGDDMMTAFIKGYMTGFGMGMVYIGAAAIAAFLEIGVLFHLGMFSLMYFEAAKSIGLAIACHAVGADKEAIMYSVIAVMCVVSACAEYGMAAEIAVTGRKGTVNIEVSNKGDTAVEGGVTRGMLTGELDGLTSAERMMVDDLLNAGNNVEIIPRSNVPNNKTPDFLVNGVKTELKTLNGTSLNTPVTRIQDGFKQGAEVVIIDGRNTGLSLEQANTVIKRILGKYGGELPGIIEIWTTEGIIRR